MDKPLQRREIPRLYNLQTTTWTKNVVAVINKIENFLIAGLMLVVTSNLFAADSELFPRPAEIEPDVKFWTRVFTEVNTKQGFIHDDKYLNIVYEKVDLPVGLSRKAQQKYIKRRKAHYERILRGLASGKRSGLSKEEQRVLDLWSDDVSKRSLLSATKRLRFQLGQADKYLAGLKRSGAWKAHILKTLDDMGLPREIASLPHVESSFNPKAYSKVGAAGLWQFTRSTGRRFMRIDHIVDERMDPFKATVAAARLLENNYAVIGTWPLALTAYNHGAAGMRNAARRMGTTDITTILRKYRSRTFKFASRNFYVAFLAAVDVERNAEKYFGKVVLDSPIEDEIVKIPAYMAIDDIQRALGLSLAELKAKNPALRPSVWQGQKYVPRGYEFRVGKGTVPNGAAQAIASVAASKMYAEQKPDLYHRVRRGETLSTIASRYRTNVREIMALNNLRSKHRIYVGQVLRLPQRGGTTTVAASKVKNTTPVVISDDGTYTVRRGDSIHKISKRFGVSQSQILALNDLKRVNRIYPGQVLRLSPTEAPAEEKVAMEANKADDKKSTVQVAMVEKEQVKLDNKESPMPDAEALVLTEEPIEESAEANAENIASSDTHTDQPSTENGSLPNLPPIVEKVPPLPDMVVAKVDPDGLTSANAADETVTQPADEVVEQQLANTEPASIAEEAEQDAQDNLDLAADPSDYGVAKNHTIEVQAAETLGHYAEWLNLRASQLRRINRMRYGKPVVIGKRIKLDFSRVTPEQFEHQRKEYHRALQEEFFTQFEIAGSEKHIIRRGDSLWTLAKRKYKIPMWLLRQYNPDLSINNVKPGTEVTFPRIEARADKEASKPIPAAIVATNK
ncbi:LysM peptidoglycan-binding domain-containing protein [Kaarinaea lacus]